MTMELLGYAGWYWADEDIFAGVEALQPSATNEPNVLRRFAGAPAYGGAQLSESAVVCQFGIKSGVDILTAFDALFRRLDPTNPAPRDLIAQRHDGTLVRRSAIVSTPSGVTDDDDVNVITVVFTSVDPAWESFETTTIVKEWTASTIDTRQSVLVRGSAPVYPIIRIEPLAQRPTQTAEVGWKWKQQITYTNTSNNNVYRYPWRIVMNTATEVTAGRMRSDGDDLRLRFQGDELPRTFQPTTMNTAATGIWFLLPAMAPGQSVTIDVMYGNPAATDPPVLVYPDFPVFDLATSTNGTWEYRVANNASDVGLGLWRTELEPGSTDRVKRVSFDVPGAWRPYLMLDNADHKGQPGVVPYVVSGTTYAAGRLYAIRYRGGASAGVVQGKGQGDGVAIYHPLGITSITAAWLITNPALPATGLAIGRFGIRTRNTGGEEWIARYDNTTVYATPTVVASATYATGNNPHVWFGVLPRDEVEIAPETDGGSSVLARTTTTFSIAVNSSLITASAMTARTEVYDMQQTIRLHTSPDDKYPLQELVVGRESFPLNRKLEIDGAAHTVKVYDFDGVTLLRASPWAVACYVVEFDADTGLETRRPASDWFRIGGVDLIPGFSFEDAGDETRWTQTFINSGLSVAWTRDSAQSSDGGWSGRFNISANTSGLAPRQVARTYDRYYRTQPGAWIRYAADLRTANANLMPKVGLTWYDAAKAELTGTSLADWSPAANAWYGRQDVALAPANAAYYRVRVFVTATVAGAVGNVYVDNIGIGGADIEMRDKSLLASTRVSVIYRDRWL